MIEQDLQDLLDTAKERDEMQFLYNISKLIAESDSIGEGYGYCQNYTWEDFNNGMDNYALQAGIYIYELYLRQIGVIK